MRLWRNARGGRLAKALDGPAMPFKACRPRDMQGMAHLRDDVLRRGLRRAGPSLSLPRRCGLRAARLATSHKTL